LLRRLATCRSIHLRSHGLGIALSLASLYMVLLVYATQRRDDQLTDLREQLTWNWRC
jgi:hypothetical protein